MTAPNREILANHYATTLNGAIDADDTAIVVADGSGFPSSGNFRCIIEEELVLVTARSGNNLTVVRQTESTGGATHAHGTVIETIFTAGGFEQFGRDNVPLWGYSPPLARIVADDGVTALTASDFTWVNQEASTVADDDGMIVLRAATTAALDNRLLVRTAPSTPYAYIAAMQVCGPRGGTTDACFATIGFRESSTGEFELLQFGTNDDESPGLVVARWTSATVFSSTVRGLDWVSVIANALWFRIEDDGSQLIYSVGMDGVNWIEVVRTTRTTLMAGGPDQVFWGARNDNNGDNVTQVKLLHWSRES